MSEVCPILLITHRSALVAQFHRIGGMTVEQLLARINERHGAGFRLHGRYAFGENQGA